MKTNSLVNGAIVLTVSAVVAKLFSAIYRIMLTRILGGVGIGLYQLVFPVYSMCLVLSTTGLPLAVSKVVAKQKESGSIVGYCFRLVSIVSVVIAVVIFLFSDPLAKSQGDQRISICFKILSPTIIIVGLSSVLRGYFQGKMNYYPSAISQILEQFIKMAVGLILAFFLIEYDVVYAIVGAILGIVVSEIVSLGILFFSYKKVSVNNFDNRGVINKREIIKDILPITITNLILPIAAFVDSVLVVRLLGVNFDSEVSIFLYGIESGAVNNIATLPTMFSFSVASVIMPKFSSKEDSGTRFSFLFQIVLLIVLPCVVMFFVDPEGILKILYSNKLSDLGIDGLSVAKKLLRVGGLGTLFLSLNQILSSYLQANDKRSITIKNLLIGVAVKFVLEVVLLLNVDINILALSISNSLCYLIVFVLNLFETIKLKSFVLEKNFYLKTAACVGLMLVGYFMINLFSSNIIVTLISYFVAGISYLFGIYLLNLVSIKKSNIRNFGKTIQK